MAGYTILYETALMPRFPLSRRELKVIGDAILEAIGLIGHQVTLKLVDDAGIARLNSEFLGCTGPTNILSFPAESEEGQPDGYLGELALSVDTLAREADLYGQPPLEHLARLVAHGTLHLAGYEHGDEMYDLTDTAIEHVLLICA